MFIFYNFLECKVKNSVFRGRREGRIGGGYGRCVFSHSKPKTPTGHYSFTMTLVMTQNLQTYHHHSINPQRLRLNNTPVLVKSKFPQTRQ